MAGPKLSPRQQMINMMYLVLLCLLALQVSNAVLDKFIFIDQSLLHAVGVTREKNDDKIHAIEQQVEDKGNKDLDVDVLNRAHKAHDLTQDMMTYLSQFRKTLVEKSGGRDTETDKLVDASGYDKQMAWTLGPTGSESGSAYELEDKLNNYVREINSLHDSLNLPLLALAAKDIPEFKNDDHQRNKDFAHLNFDHTPTAACLAVLSQFKSEVARVESQVLERLAEDVGAAEFRFDKIIAVVKPESKIVAAGTKYKAQMFLSASSSTVKPRMTFNGNSIKVEEGIGQIEFSTSGGKYNKEGKISKRWKGEITFNGPFGDTTFYVDEEYIVAKPVVQIQAAAVSALYLNCGNELNVQVPALGSAYDPSFTATGAQVIKGAKKGFITVVPNRGKVSLNVSSGGNRLSTENFKVRRVPIPTIRFTSRGREIDLKNGVSANNIRSLEAKAIPDKSFAEFLPKDARYRVVQWEITLARGKRAVGQPMRVKKEKVSLGTLTQKAKPGDRIVIEVKKVKRQNFQNKIEDVKGLGIIVVTIPLTK